MSQGWRSQPLPPNWHTLRGIVLTEEPTCSLRILCNGAPSTEVHHLNNPGDHTRTNLTGVCSPCHRTVTARNAATIRNKKYSRRRPEQPHPGVQAST